MLNGEKRIKFEGEYLNGQKWNGIGFDIKGEKQYELKNGSGYIYEYDNSNKLSFEGEVIKGIKTGMAKEYIQGMLDFEGFYFNGKRQGKGKIYDYNGGRLWYEGDFINGKKNGYGKEYLDGCLDYKGEFIDDQKNGKGKSYFSSIGKLYEEGIFFKNRLIKGKIYSGDGMLREEVKYRNFAFDEYMTEFLWKGKIYNKRGILEYEGTKLKGKMWNGIGYNPKGEKAFEIRNGIGRIKKYFSNGKIKLDADSIYGYIFGWGKEYYENGNIKYDGLLFYLGDEWGQWAIANKYDEEGKLIYSGKMMNGEEYIEPNQSYIKTKIMIIVIIIFFIAFDLIFNVKQK